MNLNMKPSDFENEYPSAKTFNPKMVSGKQLQYLHKLLIRKKTRLKLPESTWDSYVGKYNNPSTLTSSEASAMITELKNL